MEAALFARPEAYTNTEACQASKNPIDEVFVVPSEHRPSAFLVGAADNIPIIDLAPLQQKLDSPADEAALKALIAEVGCACEEWGFFQVVNHGIPVTILQNLKEQAKAFFELPSEQKLQVKRTSENVLGYNNGEFTKDVRDWKEVFDVAVDGSLELPADVHGDDLQTHVTLNQWPSSMPHLREACEGFTSASKRLTSTLLHLIAQSLGLPSEQFDSDYFPSKTSRLRINHYPVCPAPELALGLGRHKDSNALTILFQDEVSGLEVKRKDGKWVRVNPESTALIINVGDVMQVYSNDKYQSVEHRVVVNENKERYSYLVGVSPAHWACVAPLAELTNEKHPPRYRPFTWGQYLKRKTAGNFKHGVENLQIYHYAIKSS